MKKVILLMMCAVSLNAFAAKKKAKANENTRMTLVCENQNSMTLAKVYADIDVAEGTFTIRRDAMDFSGIRIEIGQEIAALLMDASNLEQYTVRNALIPQSSEQIRFFRNGQDVDGNWHLGFDVDNIKARGCNRSSANDSDSVGTN